MHRIENRSQEPFSLKMCVTQILWGRYGLKYSSETSKYRQETELIDITRSVEEIMRKSGIANGLCVVHTVHSTTAVIVNEHEDGLTRDIVKKIQQDFPKGAGWLHDRIDDNADAHLASSFIGPTMMFPVQEGRLLRGTWQNVFLLELDGPRTRRITVEVMGE